VSADEFVTKTKNAYRPMAGKFGKPGGVEEIKMSKAKLIKRREWLEREQVTRRQALVSAAALVKVDTVRNWVKRHQATPKPNSRELFAALFAQPQAS
jgi:hypothetical protein